MPKIKRDDRGFTLVELLVATAIGLALIGVTVALVTSALQSEPRSTNRSSQIEAGRVMLERITRELREGCRVEPVAGKEAGQSLAVFMDCDTGPTYNYTCETGQCEREDVEKGTSALMVDGLEVEGEAWPVFVLSDDNDYVEIQLRFPRAEADGESVTLSDGVAMRNQQPEAD